MKIRSVKSTEIEALQAISIQTFCETFDRHNTPDNMKSYIENYLSVDRLNQEYANPNSKFYFAEFDNKIAGYLKLNSYSAQTESILADSFEIERIYILKTFQRLNIGQLLFNFSIMKAMEHQAKVIWLGVWEHNYKAQRFYIKNKMEYFSSHLFMLGNDEQTDVLMKLELR